VKSYGYECEIHEIGTKDEYILRTYRISPLNRTGKYPILMQHGIIHTSGAFIISGRNSGAFYLVDNGFDVWLGNARGNSNCLKHKKMSYENPKYWDFSFHEIGIYDLPAVTDYILKTVNSPKLVYIGHSEGGSAAAVLLSTIPKYNEKIAQIHLVSPAIFLENLPNNILKTFIVQPLMEIYKQSNNYDQLINNFPMKSVWLALHHFYSLCREKVGFCELITNSLCGSNINGSLSEWPMIYKYHKQILISETISVKKFIHFAQLVFSKKFRPFDYDERNFKFYGKPTPPDYNLKNIITPTYIYAGERDGLVSPIDLLHLKNSLPNVKKFKYLKNYNHCDIVFGQKVIEDYYFDILKAIQQDKLN
jgi:pimeloyl-ACP methyl ester carboxylesterase